MIAEKLKAVKRNARCERMTFVQSYDSPLGGMLLARTGSV